MRRSAELLPPLLLLLVASLGVWPPRAAAQFIFGRFTRFDCSEEEAQWFCRSWRRPRAPSPPLVEAASTANREGMLGGSQPRQRLRALPPDVQVLRRAACGAGAGVLQDREENPGAVLRHRPRQIPIQPHFCGEAAGVLLDAGG